MSADADKTERLQKVMAHAGVASRRKSEELILAGRVTVNGKTIRQLGVKVDPEADEICIDTVPIKAPTRNLSFLINKPKGYLCTTKDDQGRQTVMDLLPRTDRRLYPAGRLDEDSQGLLILTDDGDLANLVTHPRYGIEKTYDLRIRGRLEGTDASRVQSGVWLGGGRTKQSRLRIRKRGRDVTRVEVTLAEGRNRELRRIFAKIGHPVLSLRRIRIGNLTGKGLRFGQVRKLSHREISDLKALAKKA